jgi:hypothetical protein
MSGRGRGVLRRGGPSSDSDSDEDMDLDLDDMHNVFAVGTALRHAVLASRDTDSGSSLDFSSEDDRDDYDSPPYAYHNGFGSEARHGPALFYAPFKDGTFGANMQQRKKQYAAPVPGIPQTFATEEVKGWHGLFMAAAGCAKKETILMALQDPSSLFEEGARTPPSADISFPVLTKEQERDVRQGMLHHIRDGQCVSLLFVVCMHCTMHSMPLACFPQCR